MLTELFGKVNWSDVGQFFVDMALICIMVIIFAWLENRKR